MAMPTHHEELLAIVRRLSPEALPPEPAGVRAELPELKGIRAVVFDVYGTLFVSASGDIGVHAANPVRAAAEALEAAGLAYPDPEDALAAGPLLEKAIREAHAESRRRGVPYPEIEIREIWKTVLGELARRSGANRYPDDEMIECLAVEYECRVNPAAPMPGLADVLERLREAGAPMGIVSNAQFYTPHLFEAFLDESLEELGIPEESCVWSWRLREGKPSTRLYIEMIHRMGLARDCRPEEILYIGNDMLKDIWPAARVGCRAALFAGDARSLRMRTEDPRCENLTPAAILTDLRQIPPLLGIGFEK